MFSRSRTFDTTSYAQLLESRAKAKGRANGDTVLANSARKRFGTECEVSTRPGLVESSSEGPGSRTSTSAADRTTPTRPGTSSNSSPRPGPLECQLCFQDLDHAVRYRCRECHDVCLCSNCVINSSIVHPSNEPGHIFELSQGDGCGLLADSTMSRVMAISPTSEGADYGSVGEGTARKDVGRPSLSDGSLVYSAGADISAAPYEVLRLGFDNLANNSPGGGAGDDTSGSMSPRCRGSPQILTRRTQVQTRRSHWRKQLRPRPQPTPTPMPDPVAQEGIFEFLCRAADQYFQHQTSSIEAKIERRITQRIEQRIERRIERRIEQRVMARLSRQLHNAPHEDGDGADSGNEPEEGPNEANEDGGEADLGHGIGENDADSDDGGSSLDRILDFTDDDLELPRTRRNRPWLPRDKRQLCKLKGQGATEEEIGLQLGRSPGAVSQQWRKLRIAACL